MSNFLIQLRHMHRLQTLFISTSQNSIPQNSITIRTNINQPRLSTIKIKHNQRLTKNPLTRRTRNKHRILPQRLNLTTLRLTPTPRNTLITINFPPKIQTQNNSTQNCRNSQININQTQSNPIRISPLKTKPQTKIIKVMMNNIINPTQKKQNKKRTNKPQNKNNPRKPIIP